MEIVKKLLRCDKCLHGYFEEDGHVCGDWMYKKGATLAAIRPPTKVNRLRECGREECDRNFYSYNGRFYCSKECSAKEAKKRSKERYLRYTKSVA